MKIIVTESSVSIEGKGNPRLLLALLTKAIEAVMLSLIQADNMSIMQAGFLAYQCVSMAYNEVLEMAKEEKENG